MLLKDQLTQFRESLFELTQPLTLPSEENLIGSLEEGISVLEHEKTFYRRPDSKDRSGGLLDFTGLDLPAVLVPDIHGRYEFLLSLIDFKPPFAKGKTLLELLNSHEVIVVCVGDALHSEYRGRDRWNESYEYFEQGNTTSLPMQEEMKENLAVTMLLVKLKKCFAENFHFLKGNHENILNEHGGGNLPFYKYANEGEMTRCFIRDFYSDAVLHLMSLWEKKLPLCAAFRNFCVSHAEPACFYKKKQIVNCYDSEDVILDLTWTNNDEADALSVSRLFHELTGKSEKDALWFSGHRPVEGNFFWRQNKSLVQFHNPSLMNIAVIELDKKFNPEKNIISVCGAR